MIQDQPKAFMVGTMDLYAILKKNLGDKMEKNKIIIIALIVIIVALLVGIAATTMPNVNKKDTNVTYKGKSKITEGDTINFKITTDADLELAEHIILKKEGKNEKLR